MTFTDVADHIAMHYRATRAQIDNMERSKRFPVEEIIRRRNALPMMAQAVHIVRIVADDAAIADLVAQQLEAKRNALR